MTYQVASQSTITFVVIQGTIDLSLGGGSLCSIACINRTFSLLSAEKSSSSLVCHGYRTKTWNPRAEVAMRKLVIENRLAMSGIVVTCGG